jgi:undecaprenyl diphosphate synthase
MQLVFALSYGGRAEIVDAARSLMREAELGKLDPDRLDEKTFAAHLYDPELPDPDLLIRTGNESRVSNFLLWQIAYAELYTTPVMWPDFRKGHLIEALLDFQSRERRFGLTSAQVRGGDELESS